MRRIRSSLLIVSHGACLERDSPSCKSAVSLATFIIIMIIFAPFELLPIPIVSPVRRTRLRSPRPLQSPECSAVGDTCSSPALWHIDSPEECHVRRPSEHLMTASCENFRLALACKTTPEHDVTANTSEPMPELWKDMFG